MMKIFIAQGVTGEDFNKLKKENEIIVSTFKNKGDNPYCTFLEDDSFQDKTKKGMLEHTFKKIEEYDVFLVILRSKNKSEGVLIELGYAFSKNKKFVLAVNKDVKNTYLRDLADEVIEFKSFDDLINKLKDIK